MQPGAVASRCKCTDRFVHDECLLKWLNTAQSTHCPVCLEDYKAVKLKTTTRHTPAKACWGFVLGTFCFVALLVCGSLQLSMYLSPDFVSANITLATGILMVALSAVGIVVCAVCGYRFRAEGYRAWDVSRRRQVVMRRQASAEVELPNLEDGA